jgi:hypothetical protein
LPVLNVEIPEVYGTETGDGGRRGRLMSSMILMKKFWKNLQPLKGHYTIFNFLTVLNIIGAFSKADFYDFKFIFLT